MLKVVDGDVKALFDCSRGIKPRAIALISPELNSLLDSFSSLLLANQLGGVNLGQR